MKHKLYIDIDGVVLNTEQMAKEKMKKLGISQDSEKVHVFHKNINWEEFLKEAIPINNSFFYIKKILLFDKYDLSLLTHVNSKKEADLKKEYFKKMLPEVKVITVSKEIDKCSFVNPVKSILVDDYTYNLKKWDEAGGLAIKFSDNNKKYRYLKINNLGDLINKYNEINNKLKES